MKANAEIKDLFNEFKKITEMKQEYDKLLAETTAKYNELKAKFEILLDEEELTDESGNLLLKLKLVNYKSFDQNKFKEEQKEMFEQYKTKDTMYYRVTFGKPL